MVPLVVPKAPGTRSRWLVSGTFIVAALAVAAMMGLVWRFSRQHSTTESQAPSDNGDQALRPIDIQSHVPTVSTFARIPDQKRKIGSPELKATENERDQNGTRAAHPSQPEPPEATANRELLALQGSGAPSGAWTSSAWQSLEKMKTSSSEHVELSDFRCFGRGCSVKGTYGSIEGFNRAATRGDSDIEAWQGPTFRSGPIKASSGSVDVVWILYRPLKKTPEQEEKP